MKKLLPTKAEIKIIVVISIAAIVGWEIGKFIALVLHSLF